MRFQGQLRARAFVRGPAVVLWRFLSRTCFHIGLDADHLADNSPDSKEHQKDGGIPDRRQERTQEQCHRTIHVARPCAGSVISFGRAEFVLVDFRQEVGIDCPDVIGEKDHACNHGRAAEKPDPDRPESTAGRERHHPKQEWKCDPSSEEQARVHRLSSVGDHQTAVKNRRQVVL